jgi:uncharacterized protein HemX
MKHALSAAVALALGLGLATSAHAHGNLNRQSAMPGTDLQAGTSAPARHIAATRHQQSRKKLRQAQAALKKPTHRIASLQKQHKPANRTIARANRQTERNTMSGSSQNITPTPTTPPATQAPSAGATDQKY